MAGTIDREWTADNVATLWIDNPAHRNAMNDALIERLIAEIRALGHEERCRLIVIRGRNGNFSAGRELRDLRALQTTPLDNINATYQRLRALNETLHDCLIPTLAVVEGFCFGAGATIVSWCDMAVATDDSFLCYPELQHGIAPTPAVMALLRDLPRKVAMEIMLTGRRIPAPEAARIGLVTRVVPAAELDAAVDQIAGGVCRAAPAATRATMRFIVSSDAMSVRDAMAEAVDGISASLLHPETQQRIAAFFNRTNNS